MDLPNVNSLIGLIQTLRGDKGCPWDKKQTPRSMAVYLVEEVYELLDAIDSGSSEDILEELGDVLFQILFIAAIFKEQGLFSIEDVAYKNKEKMVKRHPHVFGETAIEDPEQVRRQWREIKNEEAKNHPKNSVLDSVPRKLPALMRAYRISERAAGKGFDWDHIDGVVAKTEEEWMEFKSELKGLKEGDGNKGNLAMEFGDILFTLVNVARFARFHPETALSDATKKFEARFRYMEDMLSKEGEGLDTVSRDELERLWQVSKKQLS